jgi:hypothetical protein
MKSSKSTLGKFRTAFGIVSNSLLQKRPEALPGTLKEPLDRANGSPRKGGDFPDFMALNSKDNHLPLAFREQLQGLAHTDFKDGQGRFVACADRLVQITLTVFARVFPHIALGRSVKRFLGTNFVQRYHHKQPPQVFACRYVVVAVPSAPPKAPENGLHNIIRIDMAGQSAGASRPSQSPDAMRITGVELGECRRVTPSELPKQRTAWLFSWRHWSDGAFTRGAAGRRRCWVPRSTTGFPMLIRQDFLVV